MCTSHIAKGKERRIKGQEPARGRENCGTYIKDAKKRPLAASASHASTIPWRAALPQEGSAAQEGRQARDVKRRGEDLWREIGRALTREGVAPQRNKSSKQSLILSGS